MPHDVPRCTTIKNMVGAPLRGRAFLHMDIFLFNDVSRFRHNESGFSQIYIVGVSKVMEGYGKMKVSV